ncbi:hypothetical protein Back11_07570 [Paenibacillus baekrokdamisoli]|uniref:Uncharacterized protein n=1 Tax=Paenibacillus baekrokdamisoli TaxID=1712516 RepID=A0A3G9IMF9_9BACL|nr:ADP-ribosylglycohydrolase family protein [Paenibacillus baekrokdamisoli]MBB3067402.1 hypothetical protein [Paenibacillus baekrokdamisoli]BBH19412.1 hypothetical protein Back11_07570 [Paenibacillus baekrokdamisoli]
MFPSYSFLRNQLRQLLQNKYEQGHDTRYYNEVVEKLPDSYDAMIEFANQLNNLLFRQDWPYHEPNRLEDIWMECDQSRPIGIISPIDLRASAAKIETGFVASLCGSMLGKPLEVNPSLSEIQDALTKAGEWPLQDYISERMLDALGRRHWSWHETERSRIRGVVPDDDVNYTILGMLVLEQFGTDFTKKNVRDLWLTHLPIINTWGPERNILLKSGYSYLEHDKSDLSLEEIDSWADFLTIQTEYCGAAIRADAYGYACPGNPSLAAELAWRDASFTHRRTGIYATMFIAAAIALAHVLDDRKEIIRTALMYVPKRSRFYEVAKDCFDTIISSQDWMEAYREINIKYYKYCHCLIYQEIGTLMNSFLFAESVGDGICKQVCQGNDTDSFGATAGSLLGVYFGPGHLDSHWTAPFKDNIRTGIALFNESSISQLAKRMGRLPEILQMNLQQIIPSELYTQ